MTEPAPRRRLRRFVLVLAAALSLGVALAVSFSSEIRYLLRAGYEEARILSKRRSLDALIADPETSPQRRALFHLVLGARTFAAESLALKAGDTYTTFSDVGRDTLLLVISASPRTELTPYVWRYPIVGVVPYKGFFKASDAIEMADRLEREGLDTYVRPAGAFSTLGWFNDPLLSTALYSDSVDLVVTVLHEIAHNTLYVPSATQFNESWASFVGHHAAVAFFHSKGDSVNASRALARWRDQLRLAAFYDQLAAELKSVYSRELSEPQVLNQKDRVFAEARARLVDSIGPSLESYNAGYLVRRPLNNASVIAARIYRVGLADFDAVLRHFDGDIGASVAAITDAVAANPSADPYHLVAELVSE